MSIELQNPQTLLGQVDAAANYVAQSRLALTIGHYSHVAFCCGEAERLLAVAIEEAEKAEWARSEALLQVAAVITDYPDHPALLKAHRILATGEPDGVLKSETENSCNE